MIIKEAEISVCAIKVSIRFERRIKHLGFTEFEFKKYTNLKSLNYVISYSVLKPIFGNIKDNVLQSYFSNIFINNFNIF